MRDDGYTFLRIGAHVERADMMLRVATIVATTLMPTGRDEPFADVRAMGLLKAVGAFGTYRHRYHARADFQNTVDLLLYAPSFPRSFVYTLLEIGRDLDGLPRNAEALAALQACWPLETVDSRPALDAFVGRALPHLAALGAALALTYFSPSLPPEASAAQPPRASTVRPGETKLERQEPKEPSLDARS
jgi:uncharacterized alpha-E superfamily protein